MVIFHHLPHFPNFAPFCVWAKEFETVQRNHTFQCHTGTVGCVTNNRRVVPHLSAYRENYIASVISSNRFWNSVQTFALHSTADRGVGRKRSFETHARFTGPEVVGGSHGKARVETRLYRKGFRTPCHLRHAKRFAATVFPDAWKSLTRYRPSAEAAATFTQLSRDECHIIIS